MTKKFLSLIFSIFLFAASANAQNAEVTVSFNEHFFDTVLDAIFKNLKQPEFPLAANNPNSKMRTSKSLVSGFHQKTSANSVCNEAIRLQREINGTRTAVRFRDGQIFAPIAFSGAYNPPLIGCVEFQGVAETRIELAFDREKQALIGTVRVLDVQLGNVARMASGVLARFVQNSIDRKVNPIEILRADKLSFVVPVQNAGGALRLRTSGMRHEIGNGVLNVHVNLEFAKAE